jgi:hypothetical protein
MPRTWTHTTEVAARSEEVIEILTDPAAAMRWSPFPFALDELDGERLEEGSVARVSGSLAGIGVGFELEVFAADAARLELVARGPIDIDVLYEIEDLEDGTTDLHASVSVTGRGLRGKALSRATETLLAGGALGAAVGRIAREAEELELV